MPKYKKAVRRLQAWNQNLFANYVKNDKVRRRGMADAARQKLEDWVRHIAVVRCDAEEMHAMDDLGWYKAADGKSSMVVMRYDASKIGDIFKELTRQQSTDDFGFEWDDGDRVRLTDSQETVLEQLNSFLVMKRNGYRVAGVSSRPIPLIIAPTGTGKTFLVAHFAKTNGLPLLSLDSGAWIVKGSYTHPYTTEVLLRFVQQNDQGVIHIDELDKFFGDTDWTRHMQQEVLSLLDGGLRGYETFSPDEKQKLQDRFFICGSGTWQGLHDSKSMGFGSAKNVCIRQEVLKKAGIPYELLARFNQQLLILEPPTQDEFLFWIRDIHSELNIEMPPSVELLAQEASESLLNTRWLEGYVSRLLLANNGYTPSLL